MACHRCGTQVAASSAKYRATLSAGNGACIYLDIIVHASTDPLGLHDEFFCESCFGYWLTVFGEIGEAMKERGTETSAPRS